MSRLISDAMDRPLPWRKRAELYFHRKICVGCDRYHDQLHFTHDTIHGLEGHLDELPHEELPPEAKDHLKHSLHERTDY